MTRVALYPANRGILSEILAETVEIEEHIHNWERWLAALQVPAGNKVATLDPDTTVSQDFQITTGNNAYGNWIQLLDTADTPVDTGKTYFDFHRIIVTDVQRTTPYTIQFAFGETGAGALAAGNYTMVVFVSPSAAFDGGPADVLSKRIAAGTKAWARGHCATTGTINFRFGLHEYDE